MLRSVFGPQERLLEKVLERVERRQGSKPDELLQARFEEAHGDKSELAILASCTSFSQDG